MSLLMDALKKAEQEKKDAAKKLIGSEDELSVTRKEQIGEITDSHLIVNDEVTGEHPVEAQADKTYHTTSMDLSLEPIEAFERNPLLQKRPAEKMMTEPTFESLNADVSSNAYSEPLSLKPDVEDTPAQPIEDADKTQEVGLAEMKTNVLHDPDQTFHGVNLEQSMVAGLYEDTIQGEAFKSGDISQSYDETLPGVPAAQLARDIGPQDQPTPVAAKTLFTATGTIAKPSSAYRWLLISLGVLAVGSAVIAYYYSVTPVSRSIPSPLVAKGVETIISSQDMQAIARANTTTAVDSPAPAIAAADNGSLPPEPEAAAVSVSPVSEPTVAADPTVIEDSAITEPTDNVVARTESVTPSQPPDRLPTTIVPPASLVRISRNTSSDTNNQLVTEAYSAWQRGDYMLANQRYQQAYEQTPDNRDVLLGLAAIATRNGDTVRALQLYLRLVTLNPLDNVARAALIGLQPGENISGSISAVKSMVFDNPEQASLYFTLGKLYAAQSNWSEAQQSFFDAYRLDSTNPDYAFNLAVSLDRMDQSQSALDYYTVALDLSENNPASFNRSAASNRIQTLETGN